MLKILTDVQDRILSELDLDLVQISFDSLLQLDLNLIGLVFSWIYAWLDVSWLDSIGLAPFYM